MDLFVYIFSLIFGAIVGSFLNVCIYRIPANISLWWPPSTCPKCKTKIKFYDNIPVLSYLILRGKCRNCKTKISLQYPVIEALTSILTLFVVYIMGLTYWTAVALLVTYCLIILSVIDFKLYIIPDRFSIGLTVLGLIVFFINPVFQGNLTIRFIQCFASGAVAFFGLWGMAVLCSFIFKKEAMGGGDIKLIAAVGVLTGFSGVISTLIISSFSALVYYAVLFILKKNPQNKTIPFGPFISIGLFINILFPNNLLLLY
ncbi:MAG: prepilin peptidase [Elusimicrobiaceae bacterium]|nr:prepilin peptidase [Elusimicrobiaceae bacterium]